MPSESHLITPRLGPGVCPHCFNFTLTEAGRCRACWANGSHLDAMVPISYAPGGGPLHHELADYKRAADPSVGPVTVGLAKILSDFLARHEGCVAHAAGVGEFSCVTTVPSGEPGRDMTHPLRHVVGELVPETAARHRRLLTTNISGRPHAFDPHRFAARGDISAERVLLIDDVWTTGASAQSAAAALKRAGAVTVAVVVIGRYVNGWWGEIGQRLEALQAQAAPAGCAVCHGGRPFSLAA